MKPKSDQRDGSSGAARVQRSLGRAGWQLKRAVGATLADSLEVLSDRLRDSLKPAMFSNGAKRNQDPSHVLRHVLWNDRRLVAEQAGAEKTPAHVAPPVSAEPAAVTPPVSAEHSAPTPAPSRGESPEPPGALQDPIRTRSMARLLAGQGHHLRALSIYDELLLRPTADEALRAEADAVRARLTSACP